MSHQAPHRTVRDQVTTFLVAMSLGLLSACSSNDQQLGPAVLRGIPMIDQNGKRISSEQLGGQLLLANLMFTHCPTVCPSITRRLAQTRASLSPELRKRIRFLSLTVDPENDTPDVLKAFASRHGTSDPEWHFAQTSEESLKRLTDRLVVFEPGAPKAPASHSLALYLFDAEGQMLQRYDGASFEPKKLASEIAAADARERSK